MIDADGFIGSHLCDKLLSPALGIICDIHPTVISDALHKLALHAVDILQSLAVPLELSDRETLVKSTTTSLNKAVDSVLSAVDFAHQDLIDLHDVRIPKKLDSTADDTEHIRGLVFDKKASYSAGGPTCIENAKIAVI